jgi:hypothetical protein
MFQKEKFRSKMAPKEKKPATGIDYASRKIAGKTTGHKPDKPEPKRTWLVREITNYKQISVEQRIFYHDSEA